MRDLLYQLGRLMGDAQSVKNGTVGKRVGRRLLGKLTSRLMRSLFG